MSQDAAPEQVETTDDAFAASAPEPMPATGHARVDQVLAEVDGLGEQSLEEHLAVFTRAHESLRAVLQGTDTGPAEG